jgi:hypothetical protein
MKDGDASQLNRGRTDRPSCKAHARECPISTSRRAFQAAPAKNIPSVADMTSKDCLMQRGGSDCGKRSTRDRTSYRMSLRGRGVEMGRPVTVCMVW